MHLIEKVTIKNGYEVYQRWNYDLYLEYLRNFGASSVNEFVSKHPLAGKQFIVSEKTVTIKSVKKQWYGGYYYLGVYEDTNGSHGTVFIENINSISDMVTNGVNKFIEEFKLIK